MSSLEQRFQDDSRAVNSPSTTLKNDGKADEILRRHSGYCSSLTSVVIGDGVTSIGSFAFNNCSSLTNVVIGARVTSIGSSAFNNCSSLTSVVIPDSVTSIGSNAFYNCSSLTSIEVSVDNAMYKSIEGNLYTKDGTTLIQYAIGKKQTSFTIPDSVTSIGSNAFYNCSGLTSIEVSVDNATYKSIDGNLYTKDGTTLIQYAIGKAQTSFTIPDSVTSIGSSAFSSCSNLTSVYYHGTAREWSAISIFWFNLSLTDATRYYYSEREPTGEGNYWHYVDGVPVKW